MKMRLNIRRLILAGIILAVMPAAAIAGCSRESEVMDPLKEVVKNTPALPDIDTAAPLRTETATFALG